MRTQFSTTNKFLNVVLNNRFAYDAFIAFLSQLGKAEASHVLMDATTLRGTDLSQKERYEISTMAMALLNKRVKSVVVSPYMDINYFTISTMLLQDFNIRVFAKKHNAEQWLFTNE